MITFKDQHRERLVFFTDSKFVDDSRIQRIGDQLIELVQNHPADRRLVLDFSNVEFMTSSMIGKLVLVHKAAMAAKVELKLRNVSSPVMRVFRVTRLNKVFCIEESHLETSLPSSPILAQNLASDAVRIA